MKIDVLIIATCLFCMLSSFIFGFMISREILVNELCEQKIYDFCEVATYKLKGA